MKLTEESSAASLWETARNAVITGDAAALERVLREHPRLFAEEQPPPYVPSGPGPHYAGADARTIIAREHHFESWPELAEQMEALHRKNSAVAQFPGGD